MIYYNHYLRSSSTGSSEIMMEGKAAPFPNYLSFRPYSEQFVTYA